LGVLVIGSIHADFYVKTWKFPSPGETVKGSSFFVLTGGKGANQAVGCARLGVPPYLVSAVGGDDLGRMVLRDVQSKGVDVSYVHVDPGTHTGVAFIVLNESTGENLIVVAPGADDSLRPEHVERALTDLQGRVRVLLTQLEVPLDTVYYALRRCKELGLTTVLNPAPARKLDLGILEYVDFLTPNRVEATQLSGVDATSFEGALRAAERLTELGPRVVVLTLGSDGALLVTRGSAKHVPAFRVRVVDTVGAGDAFNAGLAVAIYEGMDIERAVLFANAVAALKITRVGAQSVPDRREVEEFLASRGELREL
jgi:ribokinase